MRHGIPANYWKVIELGFTTKSCSKVKSSLVQIKEELFVKVVVTLEVDFVFVNIL